MCGTGFQPVSGVLPVSNRSVYRFWRSNHAGAKQSHVPFPSAIGFGVQFTRRGGAFRRFCSVPFPSAIQFLKCPISSLKSPIPTLWAAFGEIILKLFQNP